MSDQEYNGDFKFNNFFFWFKRRGCYFLLSLMFNGLLFYILFHVQFPLLMHDFPGEKSHMIQVLLTSIKVPQSGSAVGNGKIDQAVVAAGKRRDNNTRQRPASGTGQPSSTGVPLWSGLPSYGSSVRFTLQVPKEGTPDLSLKPQIEEPYFGIRQPGAVSTETNFLQYWQPVVNGNPDGTFGPYRFGSSAGEGGGIGGQISFPGLKGYNLLPWARQVVAKIVNSWDKVLEEKPLAKGFAEIRLTFSRKGRITDKKIIKMSQSGTLKEKILRLIDQGSPFPALPRNFPNKDLQAILRLSCK